jgi:hypothetical protein
MMVDFIDEKRWTLAIGGAREKIFVDRARRELQAV